MNHPLTVEQLSVYHSLQTELINLATRHEELAAIQAAMTPYWVPQPPSVQAHRIAAAALRSDADLLDRNARNPLNLELANSACGAGAEGPLAPGEVRERPGRR